MIEDRLRNARTRQDMEEAALELFNNAYENALQYEAGFNPMLRIEKDSEFNMFRLLVAVTCLSLDDRQKTPENIMTVVCAGHSLIEKAVDEIAKNPDIPEDMKKYIKMLYETYRRYPDKSGLYAKTMFLLSVYMEECEYGKEPDMFVSDPTELKTLMDMNVIGQDKTKKTLSVAVTDHVSAMLAGLSGGKQHTLLVGDTGSGKSLIAEEAAKASGLPYTIADASTLTESGWAGRDIAGVIKEHYDRYGMTREAEYGIIIFDEFDKLTRMGTSSAGENVGRSRQSVFLAMMEGVPAASDRKKQVISFTDDGSDEMPTENLMFIFTGAFTNIDENIRKESKPGLGFNSKALTEKTVPGADMIKTRSDLEKAGVIPEFIGRLSFIFRITPLTEEEMYKAVTALPGSAIARHRRLLKERGMSLRMDTGCIRKLVHLMNTAGYGVRGCNNVISEKITELTYDAYENGSKNVCLTEKKLFGNTDTV